MPTTIDLDAIALDILRDLAAVEKRSIGKVASDLIVAAMRHRQVCVSAQRNGIPLLERKPDVVVTNELVQKIREHEGV